MKCPKCGEIFYNVTEEGEQALKDLGFDELYCGCKEGFMEKKPDPLRFNCARCGFPEQKERKI